MSTIVSFQSVNKHKMEKSGGIAILLKRKREAFSLHITN
jgi:hypothetical protein